MCTQVENWNRADLRIGRLLWAISASVNAPLTANERADLAEEKNIVIRRVLQEKKRKITMSLN